MKIPLFYEEIWKWKFKENEFEKQKIKQIKTKMKIKLIKIKNYKVVAGFDSLSHTHTRYIYPKILNRTLRWPARNWSNRNRIQFFGRIMFILHTELAKMKSENKKKKNEWKKGRKSREKKEKRNSRAFLFYPQHFGRWVDDVSLFLLLPLSYIRCHEIESKKKKEIHFRN